MTRIGLVGGTQRYHAPSFVALLNPKDERAWSEARFPPYATHPIEGALVTAICDPDSLANAEALAAPAEGIELVTDRPEDLIGQVDGVMLCVDGSGAHQRRAALFLEAGLPTFVDKPLSRCPTEAAEILAFAQECGTPIMSCSALRFTSELAGVDREALGPVRCVVGIGPGELVDYGIHVCEFLQAVLGPGVRSVRNCGDEQRNHVYLDWGEGRSAMMVVRQDTAYTFRMTLLGESGSVQLEINDSAAYYRNLVAAFVEMVRTGVEPIPHASMLEIIRVLDAGVKSRETGEEVRL